MKELLKKKNIFQVCSLAAFMLLWPTWQLAGISVRVWLVYLVTAVGGILLYRDRKSLAGSKGKRRYPLFVLLLGVFFLWNLLQVLVGTVSGQESKESQLMGMMLVLLFFIVSVQRDSWRVTAIRVILFCAAPVYLGMLWHFLINPSATLFLGALLRGEQELTSFLLLINVLAAEEYYRRKDRTERVFCLILLLTGFFLQLIIKNPMGILLMSASFFLSLALHEPVKELIKREAQLALIWFLLLSNMCLITNYTQLVKAECVYNLENSVYLELIVALTGVLFFSWWDKLPESGAHVPRYDFQITVRRILAAGILLVFLLLAMGDRLTVVNESVWGISPLADWSQAMRTYCSAHNGTFYDVLANYGLPGGLWLILLVLTAGERLWKGLKGRLVQPRLAIIVILYFVQSLFFSQQDLTTPVYIILCALVLKNNEGEMVRLEKESEKP